MAVRKPPAAKEPESCEKCGQVHKGCPGHRRHDGLPCGNPKGFKTEHVGVGLCTFHCGSTANGIKAAQREMAEELVATLGSPRPGDPFDIVIEEIARTNGHVLWLAEVVANLGYEDLVWGQTSAKVVESESKVTAHSETQEAAGVNIWVKLYQDERKHLVQVVKAAADMGIAKRQVELAEQTGRLLVSVIRATLGDPELGLTAEQQEAGHRAASRHLRSVPSAA